MAEGDHILPRKEIQATPFDQHGALDFGELERLGIAPDEVIDFSVNSNPWGPSPAVWKAMQQVIIERYPDRESLALRKALAKKFEIDMTNILVGNGTAGLLWLISMAFVQKDDLALVLSPTFGEYARSVALMGAENVFIWASEEDNFTFTPETIQKAFIEYSPRLAYICNPNNPTGTTLSLETIQDLANTHSNTLFIVDEAYIQFVPDLPSCLSLALPNLLVLRSMTKDYAIAGLRLGYTAGPPNLIEALAKVRSPWNVNAIAQEAGLAALMDAEYLSQSLSRLQLAKTDFLHGLNNLGLHSVPSETHYFIIKVGNAEEFRCQLLEHKIQVRDCTSFGLPEFIRVATRTPDDNARFLSALKEIG